MAELSEINALFVRDEREQIRNERPAGAQTGAQRTKIPSALVGRGGVALVMYHLSRLGLEHTQTAATSDAADLWIQTRGGPIVTMEVKTSTGINWPVKANQLTCSDVYAFVDLKRADIWIVRTSELRSIIAATNQKATAGVYSITRRNLPRAAEQAWGLFSGEVPWERVAIVRAPIRIRQRPNTIRKKLKNGEIKVYHYPAPSV